MDQTTILLLALAAATVAVVAATAAIVRGRAAAAADGPDTPFATSTEGMKVCPSCGMGNLWTETTCSACGGHLRG